LHIARDALSALSHLGARAALTSVDRDTFAHLPQSHVEDAANSAEIGGKLDLILDCKTGSNHAY